MVTGTSLSAVFPLGSRLNEHGRLEVGGCDTIELAREFGTPAYVFAEDDLRARARAFVQAGRDAGHEDFHVVFASKAFPCTAVLQLFAREGLWCDVASGGELHLAMAAGFPAERIVLHGNAKSQAELTTALGERVGLIVIDNLTEVDRLRELIAGGALAGGAPQPVLIRVAPDVSGDTHAKISTGQARTKFGFSLVDAPAAIEAVGAVEGLELVGLHAHIGSSCRRSRPPPQRSPSSAPSRSTTSAGGSVSPTRPISIPRASRTTSRPTCRRSTTPWGPTRGCSSSPAVRWWPMAA